MIKGVIFDMDGVIVDTEHLHIKAEKQVMAKYNIEITDEQLLQYTGSTSFFIFSALIKKYNLNVGYKQLFKEKEKILIELLEKNTKPIEGVISLIIILKKLIKNKINKHYDD